MRDWLAPNLDLMQLEQPHEADYEARTSSHAK
jgi:hypothetical protein